MERKTYPKESEIIITTLIMMVMIALYVLYVYKKYVSVNPDIINDPQFWGKAFIYMIPVFIPAMIIVMIIYAVIKKAITKEDLDTLTDERDKLIDLKALRISQYVSTLCMFLALGSQALGMKIWVMFVILILSCFLRIFVEGFAKVFFYRRGF
jgi:cell division protein FtsL